MNSSIFIIFCGYYIFSSFTVGFDFVYKSNQLQVKRSKDAVFDFNYKLDKDDVLQKITFRFNDKIIAVHKSNGLSFNPELDDTFKDRIDIDSDWKSKAKFIFKQVAFEDSGGKFSCNVGYENLDKKKDVRSSIKLQVVDEPSISSITPSPKIVYEYNENGIERSDDSISCVANGIPKPNISWYKVGEKRILAKNIGEVKLKFLKINRTQTGNYTCVANNIAGSVHETVEVIVQYAPEINKIVSSSVVGTCLKKCKWVHLYCIAEGVPKPKYRWNHPNGQEIAAGSNYSFFPNTKDFGVYTCEASNVVGSAQHKVTVKEIRKPSPVDIKVYQVQSKSVRVLIKIVDLGDSGVLKELKLSYESEGKVESQNLLKNQTDVILSSLKPYTKYVLNVTVKNEYLESDGQRKQFQTTEDVPEPPSNINIISISPTVLNISWNKSLKPNGVIENYEVVLFKKGNARNVSNSFSTGLITYALLNDLSPFTLYNVQVRASTKVGNGPWSEIMEKQTEPNPPSEPMNITVKVENEKTAVVQWLPPLLNGGDEITKFQIYIEITSKEDRNNTYKTSLLLNRTSQGRKYKITTLVPYTLTRIAIREGGGQKPVWGNFSEPNEFSMPEGVPARPTGLTLLDKDYDRLHLKWDRPTNIFGALKSFHVFAANNRETVKGELKKQLKNQTFYFTLTSLKPNKNYEVFVKASNGKASSADSNRLAVTMGQAPGKLVSDEPDTTAILGGCVAVIVFIIIIVILFLYVSRKKRLKQTPSVSSILLNSKLSNCDNSMLSPIHMTIDGGTQSNNGSIINGHTQSEYGRNTQRTFRTLKPIPVAKLKDFVSLNKQHKERGFLDEFRSIKPDGDFTYNISMKAENKYKNRYANILAYDHSRVVLNTVENLDESDYINANYINGYNRKAKFIATQGPVSAAFNDFWRMVWEQNSYTIVMVTNLIEKSRVKCQKYWPNDEEKKLLYGKVFVELVDEIELADYVMRRFKVSLMKNNSEVDCRKITQYQFLSWPDHGVPQYANPLIQFVKRIRAQETDNVGPIICHCSAGVGRTGTYIVIDAMLDQIDQEKCIDIFGFTSHIRSQRNLMVQTELQYMFIYNAVLEYVLCGNTEINTYDLPSRIKHLNTLNPTSSCTYMQEEYERLGMNINDTGNECESALLPCNEPKNRFQDKLPFETSRVKLWPYPNVEGSDYINASFIDGYQQKEAFILTQAPLENTIQDFWRMLWEYEVVTVVMVSSAKERDMHHCYPYWPLDNEPASFGLLRVQITAEEEKKGYVKREFRVTNSKNGEARVITHFMYTDWFVEDIPDCANILDMIGSIQKTQQQTGNNSIVMHCSDGSGRSGTLSALMFCLERLKLEGMVDVFQTVRTMRSQRTDIIQSLVQYQFIYSAVRNFLDCFSNYANFK